MTAGLMALAAEAGILSGYVDQTGTRRRLSPETARALLAAMGLEAISETAARETRDRLSEARRHRPAPPWRVISAGLNSTISLSRAVSEAWLVTEDGAEHALVGAGTIGLPPLPIGRHWLMLDGWRTVLLAAPPALALPPFGWGVTVPLYGLRAPDEGGLASYGDLARAARAAAAGGAQFLGVNPVHAGFPDDPEATSPYSPSHRRRFSIAHIAPDAAEAGTPGALIEHGADLAARRAALEADFATFTAAGGDPSFEAWRGAEGAALEDFAIHQALSERFGPYWGSWPAAFQRPGSADVRRFAAEHAERVSLHAWAQWRAEAGLAAAAGAARGMRHGLYLDLAVGTHPEGAETWAEPGLFARGASLGAPPDPFAPQGQRWNLAPFRPDALIEAGFAPLAETLAAQLRYAGMLRIDHVLGFQRAFWVPDDGAPGAYVAMPRAAMLAVARIEAARAGAVIVGEDLGAVPDGLRPELSARGILGCRLAMFEHGADGAPRPPDCWAEATLAAFGTHDLPTWRGWRAGRDIAHRAALGLIDHETARIARRRRAAEVAAFDRAAGTAGGDVNAMHRYLGHAASRLVALQIEDILGLDEQPNLPGTTAGHPNWRRRLPGGAAALRDARLGRAAAIMAGCGRGEDDHAGDDG